MGIDVEATGAVVPAGGTCLAQAVSRKKQSARASSFFKMVFSPFPDFRMGGAQGPTRRRYLGVQSVVAVSSVVEGVGEFRPIDGSGRTR